MTKVGQLKAGDIYDDNEKVLTLYSMSSKSLFIINLRSSEKTCLNSLESFFRFYPHQKEKHFLVVEKISFLLLSLNQREEKEIRENACNKLKEKFVLSQTF